MLFAEKNVEVEEGARGAKEDGGDVTDGGRGARGREEREREDGGR